MTYRETARIMAVLQAAFPNFYSRAEDRDAAVKIWAAALEDMTYQEGQGAAMRVIRTSRFPPTVAELRQAAEDARCEENDFVRQKAFCVPVYAKARRPQPFAAAKEPPAPEEEGGRK